MIIVDGLPVPELGESHVAIVGADVPAIGQCHLDVFA